MIEKRGVRIYKFSQGEDRKELEKIFDSLLQIEDLVPVIGSGFTRGLRTKNGVVPSVDELREEMTEIMCIIDGSSDGADIVFQLQFSKCRLDCSTSYTLVKFDSIYS